MIALDRCYEILSWGSITELDPLRQSFQMQVMRVLLPIGIKAALNGSLDRASKSGGFNVGVPSTTGLDRSLLMGKAISRCTSRQKSATLGSKPPGIR